jgi:hypothetical protein
VSICSAFQASVTDKNSDSGSALEPLADAAAPTTFHPWPRLPEELKLEVLSHHLTFADDICDHRQTTLLENTLGSLIASGNRHLTSIAEEVYYKTNRFKIEIDWELYRPKPRTAAMIRHLHVYINEDPLATPPDPDIMNGVPYWLLKLPVPFVSRSPEPDRSEDDNHAGANRSLH